VIVRTEEEKQGLMKIGKILAEIRDTLVKETKPGVTTGELDELAKELFEKHGAISAPKELFDFPGYSCISVNEEVAHGIPGKRVIKEGDLVNIDVSGSKDGYFADTGISFVVGDNNKFLEKLCKATKEVFDEGLKKFKAGGKLSNVGRAVHNSARKRGYTVITNLTGHGVGHSLRDKPDHVHNYYEPRDRTLLKDGMVIAYEPFVSTNAEEAYQLDDGWTLATNDGSFVAQIEHTIIVTKGQPIVVTE